MPSERLRDAQLRWLAASVAFAATAVQLPRALSLPLWQDEVATARIVVAPTPTHALRSIADQESAPPLYYAVVWLIHRAGLGVVDLRLVSVIAASCAAGMTVMIARRVASALVAASSGVVVAVGWQPVVHGPELRAYALLLLASSAFALALLRTLEIPRPRNQVVLTSVTVVGSLTHYYFMLSLVAVLMLPLFRADARTRYRPAALAIGLGVIPFFAWTPALAAQHRHGRFAWIGGFRARDVLATYSDEQLPHLAGAVGWVVAAVSLAAVGLGAARLWRRGLEGAIVASLAVAPPALAAALWVLGEPIYLPRNLIGVAPFAAIAFWSSLNSIGVRRRGAIAIIPALAIAMSIASVALDARHRVPPFDQVASTLVREGWTDADPIALIGPEYAYLFPLSWYLPDRPDLATTMAVRDGCRRVFVVVTGGRAPRALGRADVATQVQGSRISVSRFTWAPRDGAPLRKVDAHFVVALQGAGRCFRPG